MIHLSFVLALHGMTMSEAVDTALANHPSLRAARGQSEAAEARAREARAPLLPRLTGSSSYDYSARNTPLSPREAGGSYQGTITADVLVYDFGRSWKGWDAAKAAAQASEHDAEFVERDVVAGARIAFIDALEAKALVAVARETYDNQEKHRRQIAEFVGVGLRPQIDLTRLQTRVADARAALVRAENDYRAAKALLNQAIGVSGPVDYEVVELSAPALVLEGESIERLHALAVMERPDLSAAKQSIVSRELAESATARRLLPALSAGAGGTFFGDDFEKPGWSAFAGLSLTWNLFDGLGTYAAADAAEAEVRIERARLTGLEQQVRAEVEQAKIGVDSAKAQLEAAEQALSSARELLALAEQRYAEGVGSSLELADAQLELTNASSQRVRVEYDLAAARALLLRALGRNEWN
jgi:outer membrane protein